MAKLTTEEFIAKAKAVHGDRYDYSKVKYVDSKTKVCILCKGHGEFMHTGSRIVSQKQAVGQKKSGPRGSLFFV